MNLPAISVNVSRESEGRCGAHQGHEPHPEHGTRAARGDGRCHAGDVARTHAAGRGDHKRLERRDGALALHVLLLGQLLEHVLDEANLHAFGADGEVHAHCDQQDEQDVRVHEAVNLACDIDEPCVEIHDGFPLSPIRN